MPHQVRDICQMYVIDIFCPIIYTQNKSGLLTKEVFNLHKNSNVYKNKISTDLNSVNDGTITNVPVVTCTIKSTTDLLYIYYI